MIEKLYHKLTEKFGFPDSPYLMRILKRMIAPDELEVLMELPASPFEIAVKLGIDEQEVQKKVKALWRKGVTYDPGNGHRLAPNLPILHFCLSGSSDFIDAEMLGMWKEFYEKEWSATIPDRWEKLNHLMGDIIPASKATSTMPDIDTEESFPRLIKSAEVVAVMPCACRRPLHRCDAPLNNCLVVNNHARENIAKGWAREVSVEEALALSEQAEDIGLVHMTAKLKGEHTFLCNCCGDCCHMLEPGIKRGNLTKVIGKSRFRAIVDTEVCDGCQDCIERCVFEAIGMESIPGFKKLKAVVDAEKCFGCGSCVAGCSSGAVVLTAAPATVTQ